MATIAEITSAITTASRKAFSALFAEHPGEYYYCTLVTTGEAHPPVISAWSREALSAAVAKEGDPVEAASALKWSAADSPYYCYGEQYFGTVKELFAHRQRLTPELPDHTWAEEYEARLGAMETAMARLDAEGLFGTGEVRLGRVILVEVVPPDETNRERALRLNPPGALNEWLEEAAEEELGHPREER
jgi:hypothetical protein